MAGLAKRMFRSVEDRQRRDDFNIVGAVGSRDFPLDEYLATTAQLAEAAWGRTGEINYELLTLLVAQTVAHDQGSLEIVRQKLQSRDARPTNWEEIYRLVAMCVIEKWLATEPAVDLPDHGPVELPGEIEDSVGGWIGIARRKGTELTESADQQRRAKYQPPPSETSDSDLVEQALELLRKDIDIAREVQGDQYIEPDERTREIQKLALVKVGATRLEQLAAEAGLDHRGTAESLADRIVRHLGLDESEVARIIIENTPDRVERGFATRLVPLDPVPDFDLARLRFQGFNEKYLRVGLARWLVFTGIHVGEDVLELRGLVRKYTAVAEAEEDGQHLSTRQHDGTVAVRIRRGIPWAELRCKRTSDTRALTVAMAKVAGIRSSPTLPPFGAVEGVAATWHPSTLRLLDFLDTRLNTEFISLRNLTAAHFETDEQQDEEVEFRRPQINAVRHAGDHLFSSHQACRFLADGKRLKDVSAAVRYQPDLRDSNSVLFALVGIGIEDGMASVFTSFGGNSSLATQLHDLLVQYMRESLTTGCRDLRRLERLCTQIDERAKQGSTPDRPDIMGPRQSDDSDSGGA